MANRYGRDIGRRDREGFGREGRGESGFDRTSSYGSTPWGDDESYFGGSRQFGTGYSSGPGRDYDRYDRGYGSTGISGGGYGGDSEDQGRYRQSGEYSQGHGSESRRRYSGGRGGTSFEGRARSGGNYGGSRYGERFGGRGTEDFGNYGSNYPSSERGYLSDYDDGGDDRGWWDKTSDEVASWFGDDDASRRRRMDMRSGGGHRGRGPTGYTRSDDRIREDINDRLTDYDYIDATNISVEVQGGDVTLTGTVESRYEKRLAEDIAEDVSGIKNVENRLRVNTTSGQTSSSYSTTSHGTGETGGSTGTATSGTQAKGKSSGT